MQVEDVERKFEALAQLEGNDWKKTATVERPKPKRRRGKVGRMTSATVIMLLMSVYVDIQRCSVIIVYVRTYVQRLHT